MVPETVPPLPACLVGTGTTPETTPPRPTCLMGVGTVPETVPPRPTCLVRTGTAPGTAPTRPTCHVGVGTATETASPRDVLTSPPASVASDTLTTRVRIRHKLSSRSTPTGREVRKKGGQNQVKDSEYCLIDFNSKSIRL